MAISFAIALPLGLIGLYMRLKLEDTPDYRRVEELRQDMDATPFMPIAEAVRHHWWLILLGRHRHRRHGHHLRFPHYIPAYLNTELDVPLLVALGGNVIGILVYAAAALLWGRLSDTYGRKLFVLGGAVVLVLMYPIFRIDEVGTLVAIAAG